MKEYLSGAIGENLRRAEILKQRLKGPLPAAELSGVAQRCNDTIDNCIWLLGEILESDQFGDPDFDGLHLRALRRAVRALLEIERFAMPALTRFSEDERFMSSLLFRIHQQIQYPLPHPVAACFSSDHYWIYPATNVMYVPLTDSETLLHLPDVFHEMAHPLLHQISDSRVSQFLPYYRRSRETVNAHYMQQIANRRSAGGPKAYLHLEERFRRTWMDFWLEEIVCDLFAIYTVGTPYAWAHYHLTAKQGEEVFGFSRDVATTHPADDARMKAILIGLDLIEFGCDAKQIQRRWDELIVVLNQSPDPDYHLAFPDSVIEAITVEILQGTKALGCTIATKQNVENQSDESVVKLLHTAWRRFWENPETYTVWEAQKIASWRTSVKMGQSPAKHLA